MQDEPHLIGERRTATGAVGGELGLVQLDQVLGLAAGAVEILIQPLGGAAADVGDDIADVETLSRGLDACGDAALPRPGLGAVAGLGQVAHGVAILDRAPTRTASAVASTWAASTALPDRPRMKSTSLASHQSITSDRP